MMYLRITEYDMQQPIIRLTISLPEPFLRMVDKAALNHGQSRSAFIRLALLDKLEVQSVYDPRPMQKPADSQARDAGELWPWQKPPYT